MAMADPFHLVKDEVQDSLNKIDDMFERWRNLSPNLNERTLVRKELISGCDSVQWQVDELDKAIAVAERDPARFGLDAGEISQRKKWTSGMHDKIMYIREALQRHEAKPDVNTGRREMSRMEDNGKERRNDIFETDSESQALVFREQDQDLEEISASVVKLGDIGLTIHEELASQEKLIDDVDKDVGSTMDRLNFVQKRVAHVIRKSGTKGQIMMIVFLVALLLFLIFLVFFG